VIVADVYGLDLLWLPHYSELKTPPEWAPEENEAAGEMFEAFVTQAGYVLDDFSWPQYESRYEARRAEAVEKAIKGEIVHAPADAAPAKQAAPDLMAAMQAALASAPKPKKAAKKAAKAAA
jgi:non-homologous end joining protein Ku